MQKSRTSFLIAGQFRKLLQPSVNCFAETRWKEKEEATEKIYADKNDSKIYNNIRIRLKQALKKDQRGGN